MAESKFTLWRGARGEIPIYRSELVELIIQRYPQAAQERIASLDRGESVQLHVGIAQKVGENRRAKK